MRVSDLTRERPTDVTIDLGDGDTVALTFDRNAVTPAWVATTEQRVKDSDTLSLPRSLADVILSWDVYQETEGDFPPTPENVAVFSFPAQSSLFQQIMDAAVPSRAEGNDSSAPISTPPLASAEPAPTPPNGVVPSPSAELSASPSPT